MYFTYDPLYPADPPYALEEVCHVTAVSGTTVSFDNTLPHGGPTTCRTYSPGPFLITAASNDTLTFLIDGTSIYVGLTAGAAVTSAQVASNIAAAFAAAGLAATADVTSDGCVRVTSTKPIGEGEIVMFGGTAMGTSVSTWDKNAGSCAVTTNLVPAPDGNQTGDIITASTGTPVLQQNVAGLVDGGTYTFYIWARVNTGTKTVSLAIVNDAPAPDRTSQQPTAASQRR